MTIEKLKSGSYRIKAMRNGKTYRVTIDHKPTKKEAEELMMKELIKAPLGPNMRFAAAIEEYINKKKNVLSPSTIVGYRKISRWLSDDFKSLKLCDITQENVQAEMNRLAADHSPKSVRNTHGFISAVVKMFKPGTDFHTTLPQKEYVEEYVPTDEDVLKILNYAKDSEYEVALWLAVFGLRRSEVVALKYPDDLEGNYLAVRKAVVQSENKEWITKGTKTAAGTRKVLLPDNVVELIHNRGMFYEGHPGNIWKYLQKAQKDLGLKHFKLHSLRKYYASTAHYLGVPDVYIMANNGWASDNVLKETYRKALDDKTLAAQQFVADYISKLAP